METAAGHLLAILVILLLQLLLLQLPLLLLLLLLLLHHQKHQLRMDQEHVDEMKRRIELLVRDVARAQLSMQRLTSDVSSAEQFPVCDTTSSNSSSSGSIIVSIIGR